MLSISKQQKKRLHGEETVKWTCSSKQKHISYWSKPTLANCSTHLPKTVRAAKDLYWM